LLPYIHFVKLICFVLYHYYFYQIID